MNTNPTHTPAQERRLLREERASRIRATHGPDRSTLPVTTGGHVDQVPVYYPHEELPPTFPGEEGELLPPRQGGRQYVLFHDRQGLPYATVVTLPEPRPTVRERYCPHASCDLQGRPQGRRRSCSWCGGQLRTRGATYFATPHRPGGRYSPDHPDSLTPAVPSKVNAQRLADRYPGYVVRSVHSTDDQEAQR